MNLKFQIGVCKCSWIRFLKVEFINDNLSAKTKTEALAELVNTIIQGGLKLDSSAIIEVLKQRENLGSTGIGDGVAIPHGKVPDLGRSCCRFRTQQRRYCL